MISYKCGYKYRLEQAHVANTGITLSSNAAIDQWVHLSDDGQLTIAKGYAWDGASGPCFDTPNIIRPSLVHDALYQLMRESAIPSSCREYADGVLYRLCRENGMGWIRAQWIYWAVRLCGNYCMRHDKAPKNAP